MAKHKSKVQSKGELDLSVGTQTTQTNADEIRKILAELSSWPPSDTDQTGRAVRAGSIANPHSTGIGRGSLPGLGTQLLFTAFASFGSGISQWGYNYPDYSDYLDQPY